MCAIVGVYGSKEATALAYYSLFAMQHRGQESTGISSADGHKIHLVKNKGRVNDVYNELNMSTLTGNCAIGHNRYSTAGSASLPDAQPVFARYKLGEISVVHNGNLVNKTEVRNRLIENGAIFQTEMDTENIVHLIANSQEDKLVDRIKDMLTKIEGAYCLAIQSRSKMFVVRDKYGIRPLSLGKLEDGGWIVASETCAFDLVGATFVRDVEPGEMLIFDDEHEGEFTSEQIFEPDFHPCAFEYIYFARPDSIIDGKNVYETRLKMGKRLAIEEPCDVDLVLPVPDSGVAAAMGYAQGLGVGFEMAIVRNHYVGRTFIEPTQAIRDQKVRLKLSPIKSLIEGKRVAIVDDSLVRGTTSKQIVKMLKDAGAAEVHMRIASPEIKYPCRYGIDTPTKEELISSSKTPSEIADDIGATTLGFLSVEGLVEALGNDRNYSLVSFTGDYFAGGSADSPSCSDY